MGSHETFAFASSYPLLISTSTSSLSHHSLSTSSPYVCPQHLPHGSRKATRTASTSRRHRKHPQVTYMSAASTAAKTNVLSNVLIIGASRGLGAVLTSYLHEQNVTPLVTTHRPQTQCSEIQRIHSTSVKPLDASDRSATFELFESTKPSIVISCIGAGVDFSLSDEEEEEVNIDTSKDNGVSKQKSVTSYELQDLQMTKNLIDAARNTPSITRFIFISSLGAGNSEDAVPPQVMTTMRPFLLDKTDAEAYLRNAQSSNTNWTIIRPAPLIDGEPTSDAVVTEDVNCYGTLSRPDFAQAIVKIAQSESAIGQTLHVVDRKKVLVTSPYVRPLEFWEGLPFTEYDL